MGAYYILFYGIDARTLIRPQHLIRTNGREHRCDCMTEATRLLSVSQRKPGINRRGRLHEIEPRQPLHVLDGIAAVVHISRRVCPFALGGDPYVQSWTRYARIGAPVDYLLAEDLQLKSMIRTSLVEKDPAKPSRGLSPQNCKFPFHITSRRCETAMFLEWMSQATTARHCIASR